MRSLCAADSESMFFTTLRSIASSGALDMANPNARISASMRWLLASTARCAHQFAQQPLAHPVARPVISYHHRELGIEPRAFSDAACDTDLAPLRGRAGKRDQCDFTIEIRMGETMQHVCRQLAQRAQEAEIPRFCGQGLHESLLARSIFGANQSNHDLAAVAQPGSH